MAIFPGDVIIKNAIELSLEDMKKNPWVIDDVFSVFIENPMLRDKYGIKEVNRAREFILNNKIHFFMGGRMDKEEFPCVTISVGPSGEDKSLATLGDSTVDVEELDPSEIGCKISYIMSPFTPTGYDQATGVISVPEGLEGFEYVRSNMVAIDPETGQGFLISGKAGELGIQIPAGSDLKGQKVAIVPEYQVYRARRERATSQETYNIGCHTHGDPATTLFLFAVVKYGLYRYREALLEHENFQLGTLQASDMVKNQSFESENIYSRFITLSGQCEETWLKTPYRVIEASRIVGTEEVLDEDGNPTGETREVPGIKILSQEAPDNIMPECETWITIDDDEE